MLTRDITISADHPHFEGHFPGAPVLPAVSQIDLVLDLLRESLGKEIEVQAIQKAKFRAPIAPGTRVRITLKSISTTQVQWSVSAGDLMFSTGQVHFR